MVIDPHDPSSCPTCRGTFRAPLQHLRREAEEPQPVAPTASRTGVTEPGGTDERT